ncbi:MAG: HAD-IC family P-type ATPase [Candidatus Kerfeldbacteria bacterium]|nr:HAD-IC family P-type ATPase [Candidatus Kerfeldbacteria bacterium]
MTAPTRIKTQPPDNNIFSPFTALSVRDLSSRLQTSIESGLSAKEAVDRLVKFGPNEVKAKEETAAQILVRQWRSPFIALLVGAAVVSLALGERIDAAFIVLFVIINTLLGFYQEYRSAQALRLLKQYLKTNVTVRRDRTEQLIDSRQVVPGDMIMLKAGDTAPADVRLVEVDDLTVDESTLTGESVPITKQSGPLDHPTSDLFQAINIVFSGSTMIKGQGQGVVVATGRQSIFGSISSLATETERVTDFQQGINGFSRFILRMVAVTLGLIIIANTFLKGGAGIGEFLVFAIALAVSVIPEALPVVTTLAMSRGALHLARRKVVVKRLSAIEDLGSIEVLCTDKTGTITENNLTVSEVRGRPRNECLQAAAVGSSAVERTTDLPNSSFDVAVWQALDATGQAEVNAWAVKHVLPFDPFRRRTTVAVTRGGQWRIISRGAPEVILEHCTGLTWPARQEWLSWIEAVGRQGRRIMAVAERFFSTNPGPSDLEDEHGLSLVGMIAFHDPLKPTAASAVERAKSLGVQVKILTGDSPEVAGAVAHQVGLIAAPSRVMTGQQLFALPPPEQTATVLRQPVFARVTPEDKLRIIGLLQKQTHVGFLGEGVNDAPALKVANVSMVVAGAADIARASADIVLLQRHLQVIITGIEEGRQVFANTIKYIKATLLSNFGNFYSVAIASLLIPYLPMLPIQILLVNLLSDFPMISIAADAVDPSELRRPKSYQIREVALLATILGLVSTVFDFVFFGLFSRISPAALQTNWFIGSILTELVVIYSIRTRLPFFRAKRPPALILWLTIAAAVVTIALPLTKLGQTVFRFSRPEPIYFLWIAIIVVGYFYVTEVVKHFYYRYVVGRSRHPELAWARR